MDLRDLWNNLTGQKITIYADFIDPFCYLGFSALKPLAETHHIDLEWKGFEFNPETPPEGLPLETASNSDIRPGMSASVISLAKQAGIELREPQFIPNTLNAHALVYLARKSVVKIPLIERIYQSYFIGRQDIGRMDVLIDLASAFGITADQVGAIEKIAPTLSVQLEKWRGEAQKREFLGMPGFIYKGQTYFGALSHKAWEDIFQGGGRRGR